MASLSIMSNIWTHGEFIVYPLIRTSHTTETMSQHQLLWKFWMETQDTGDSDILCWNEGHWYQEICDVCTERYIRHNEGHWKASTMYSTVYRSLSQTENANLGYLVCLFSTALSMERKENKIWSLTAQKLLQDNKSIGQSVGQFREKWWFFSSP